MSKASKQDQFKFNLDQVSHFIQVGASAAEFEALITKDDYQMMVDFAKWVKANKETISQIK